MLRLSDNPPILSTRVNSLAELTGTWWIAHTRARFEKVFAWDMLKLNVGYFLPMRQKVIFSGGRKRRVLLPLFASYVFFCGTESDRYKALATNRLCQALEVVDQEGLIVELVSIEKALLSEAVIGQYISLPAGSRCRITSGPMMGIEGVVISTQNAKARVVLEVTILGQGAVVEIDIDLLELLE